MLYLAASFLGLAREYESIQASKQGWEIVYSTCWTIALSVLALFVAWSMSARRNKWIVLLSSVVGILLCLPAPLAVVILMRLRHKEIWNSFDTGRKGKE